MAAFWCEIRKLSLTATTGNLELQNGANIDARGLS